MTLALPPRSGKPRTRGITSMIDFGPDTFGWTGAPEGIRNVLDACAEYIDYAKIYALKAQPWFDRLLIEADPYRFPQQHADLVKTFGPEINLANITPGQVLRLEGFRRGIGRAVDYSIIAR